MPWPSKGAASCSMVARKARGSPRSGVMSLKTIPFLGKSGTSVTNSLSPAASRMAAILAPLPRGTRDRREQELARRARLRLARRGAPAVRDDVAEDVRALLRRVPPGLQV